jgi:hypothetical protein
LRTLLSSRRREIRPEWLQSDTPVGGKKEADRSLRSVLCTSGELRIFIQDLSSVCELKS